MRLINERVCPNVRHENIILWLSSWRLKFIHSQFPLPMSLNSVFSFIKMSDRDLKFVYLFCQTDTFLVGIYGKCMTQTKSMNPTTIHTGKVWGMSQSIKKTYTKTYIYI